MNKFDYSDPIIETPHDVIAASKTILLDYIIIRQANERLSRLHLLNLFDSLPTYLYREMYEHSPEILPSQIRVTLHEYGDPANLSSFDQFLLSNMDPNFLSLAHPCGQNSPEQAVHWLERYLAQIPKEDCAPYAPLVIYIGEDLFSDASSLARLQQMAEQNQIYPAFFAMHQTRFSYHPEKLPEGNTFAFFSEEGSATEVRVRDAWAKILQGYKEDQNYTLLNVGKVYATT